MRRRVEGTSKQSICLELEKIKELREQGFIEVA